MAFTNALLQQPPGPGHFPRCPYCRAWFGLRLVRIEADAQKGTISIYRCVKCEAEVEFAHCHPPGVV